MPTSPDWSRVFWKWSNLVLIHQAARKTSRHEATNPNKNPSSSRHLGAWKFSDRGGCPTPPPFPTRFVDEVHKIANNFNDIWCEMIYARVVSTFFFPRSVSYAARSWRWFQHKTRCFFTFGRGITRVWHSGLNGSESKKVQHFDSWLSRQPTSLGQDLQLGEQSWNQFQYQSKYLLMELYAFLLNHLVPP